MVRTTVRSVANVHPNGTTQLQSSHCRVHDLPVKINLLRIDKLQNRSPEYLALNPLGKVPFLEDGDTIHIPKSAAILCYLAAKFNVGSPWCPPSSDLVARAMFDAAMHWQHTTVRLGCTRLVFNRVLGRWCARC